MQIRRGTRVVVLSVLAGLAVGVGVFAVPRVFDSASASVPYHVDPHHSVATFPPGVGGVDTRAGDFARPVVPTDSAMTPNAAVAFFLDARTHGDLERAWQVVSDADRRQYPDAVDYESANGELPRVLQYTLAPARTNGDRATVAGSVTFAPMLDEVAGEVPAHATVNWSVMRERGAWHVVLGESGIRPQYPNVSGATTAALAWAANRQRCDTTPQWNGPLLGSDGDYLANKLCHRSGALQVQAAHELDDNESSDSFLAAFGSDVFTWARVVPLRAPVSFDIVLAPYGDHWSVIGAIDASPYSG
jgi:hypothetical protein